MRLLPDAGSIHCLLVLNIVDDLTFSLVHHARLRHSREPQKRTPYTKVISHQNPSHK